MERYEFEHFAVDIGEITNEDMAVLGAKKRDIGVFWMSPDMGEGYHTIWSFERFKNKEDLEEFENTIKHLKKVLDVNSELLEEN